MGTIYLKRNIKTNKEKYYFFGKPISSVKFNYLLSLLQNKNGEIKPTLKYFLNKTTEYVEYS
jgi:hypothetical protein